MPYNLDIHLRLQIRLGGIVIPYITLKQSPMYHQITFDEIISGNVNAPKMITSNESNTRTYYTENLKQSFLEQFSIRSMVLVLERFYTKNEELYKKDRASLYETFYIPKKTGGLRKINAPHEELMNPLRELKCLLETKMFALYHTSAFAYVPKRSTIDAVKRHQRNNSHWFLKTDFSDFFGSTTPDFLIRMLSMIFPFSEIVKSERGKNALTKALDLCFLDGGLPQGTPISPMLTNLMMIPVDHTLSNALRDFNGKSFVYTRYADDIIISSKNSFCYTEIVDFIRNTLKEFDAPFSIKDKKTRYGSRSGSNWNLGLMLNKDNKITIGHKNKQRLRAMICNYVLDKKNGNNWDLRDVQVLRGIIEYYHMIEPDYVDGVMEFNNTKYKVDVMAMIHKDLSL